MNINKKCKNGLFIFNPKDIWVGQSLNLYGEYSEIELSIFKQILEKTDIALDVGANIGCHTVALSRMCKFVFAFEPERHAFNTLCGNIAINNRMNVYCYHQAIINIDGIMEIPELDIERTTNLAGLCLTNNHGSSLTYSVPTSQLDTMIDDLVKLIKIDTNGMEKEVLLGAKNTIEKSKPFLYVKSGDFLDLLKELDYEVYKHKIDLFNENNYYENKINVFTDYVSSKYFCHHKDTPFPFEKNEFGLVKVD